MASQLGLSCVNFRTGSQMTDSMFDFASVVGLERVDIHFAHMKALTMWSMDRKALAVCS